MGLHPGLLGDINSFYFEPSEEAALESGFAVVRIDNSPQKKDGKPDTSYLTPYNYVRTLDSAYAHFEEQYGDKVDFQMCFAHAASFASIPALYFDSLLRGDMPDEHKLLQQRPNVQFQGIILQSPVLVVPDCMQQQLTRTRERLWAIVGKTSQEIFAGEKAVLNYKVLKELKEEKIVKDISEKPGAAILLQVATRDQLVNLEFITGIHDSMKQSRHVELEMFENAGHALNIDGCPDFMNDPETLTYSPKARKQCTDFMQNVLMTRSGALLMQGRPSGILVSESVAA